MGQLIYTECECSSGAKRGLRIYLPQDYETSEQHYPVLYMQDAQNLFSDTDSYGAPWLIGDLLDQQHHNHPERDMIVVGIDHAGEQRIAEFSPWPVQTTDYSGEGQAHLFADLLVTEIKPWVDQHYRTLPAPAHTALMGSSMGGLISLYIGLNHQQVFTKIAALSPSLEPRFFGEGPLNLAKIWPLSPTTNVYIDMGSNEGDDAVASVENFCAALSVSDGARLRQETIPDGNHDETSWRSRFLAILNWLYEWDQAENRGAC